MTYKQWKERAEARRRELTTATNTPDDIAFFRGVYIILCVMLAMVVGGGVALYWKNHDAPPTSTAYLYETSKNTDTEPSVKHNIVYDNADTGIERNSGYCQSSSISGFYLPQGIMYSNGGHTDQGGSVAVALAYQPGATICYTTVATDPNLVTKEVR